MHLRHHARSAALTVAVLGVAAVPFSTGPVQASATPATSPVSCFGERATIVGTAGTDRVEATDGRDVIATLGGSDVVRDAGAGDLVCTAAGDDTVLMRAGGDAASALRVSTGADDDLVRGAAGDRARLGLGDGDDVLRLTGTTPWSRGEAFVVHGDAGDDDLRGTAGPQTLQGDAGDDALHGLAGPDLLGGGPGADLLDGDRAKDFGAGDEGRDRCRSVESAFDCEA